MAVTSTQADDRVTDLLLPGTRWRNWGRVESANPSFIARPTSVDEVVAIVRYARSRNIPVKALPLSPLRQAS